MTTPFITEKRSPGKFFLLVFALSIPLWLIGALTPLQLLPGLPVSTLNVFCPLIAASILVYREDKTEGVKELLKRAVDYGRIRAKVWYVPTVLLMPGIAILAYGLMRLMQLPLPAPQFPGLAALAMFLASFIAALGEELGWMGYAVDTMQDRWNALQAGILLGVVWATWHIVPLVQARRSPAWIAWWCLWTVTQRVLIVWLYNNTGKSVFAAALFHAISNVSTLLFPEYYDPRITGLITALVAVIVTVVWGPRTLARNELVPTKPTDR
jgi:membrane protease YdiL (CAAX protease family)